MVARDANVPTADILRLWASGLFISEAAFMKTMGLWITTHYWFLWSANALLAAGTVCIFLSGLVSGFVGAHNIVPWCAILLLACAVVGGSLWQRSLGHPAVAVLPLLLFLVPLVLVVVGSLLFAAFYLVVFLCGNGRMN